jgi:hypothetical protein
MMLILLVFTVASCREEDDSNKGNNSKTVEINTVLESNGQPINIGETITLSNGRDFRLTKFRIYLSNINLVKANGDKTPITEVALTDVGDESTGSFSTAIEAGNYNSVEIDLGLNPVLNDSDPTSFPTDHPLSTFNQMYWSMLKYRFLILEGRSNISGTLGSNDDVLHAYHPGTNPSFRQVSFNLDSSFSDKLNSGNVNLELVFDLDEIFTTEPAIDMVAEPQTHSEPVDIAIAVKMMNNLAATLKLRQP